MVAWTIGIAVDMEKKRPDSRCTHFSLITAIQLEFCCKDFQIIPLSRQLFCFLFLFVFKQYNVFLMQQHILHKYAITSNISTSWYQVRTLTNILDTTVSSLRMSCGKRIVPCLDEPEMFCFVFKVQVRRLYEQYLLQLFSLSFIWTFLRYFLGHSCLALKVAFYLTALHLFSLYIQGKLQGKSTMTPKILPLLSFKETPLHPSHTTINWSLLPSENTVNYT